MSKRGRTESPPPLSPTRFNQVVNSETVIENAQINLRAAEEYEAFIRAEYNTLKAAKGDFDPAVQTMKKQLITYQNIQRDLRVALRAVEINSSVHTPLQFGLAEMANKLFGEDVIAKFKEADKDFSARDLLEVIKTASQCIGALEPIKIEEDVGPILATKCWICGLPINRIKYGKEECEHILPVAQAVYYLALYGPEIDELKARKRKALFITEKLAKLSKPSVQKMRLEAQLKAQQLSPEEETRLRHLGVLSLWEYDQAHSGCNQLKSDFCGIFAKKIVVDGSVKLQVVIDEKSIKKELSDLFDKSPHEKMTKTSLRIDIQTKFIKKIKPDATPADIIAIIAAGNEANIVADKAAGSAINAGNNSNVAINTAANAEIAAHRNNVGIYIKAKQLFIKERLAEYKRRYMPICDYLNGRTAAAGAGASLEKNKQYKYEFMLLSAVGALRVYFEPGRVREKDRQQIRDFTHKLLIEKASKDVIDFNTAIYPLFVNYFNKFNHALLHTLDVTTVPDITIEDSIALLKSKSIDIKCNILQLYSKEFKCVMPIDCSKLAADKIDKEVNDKLDFLLQMLIEMRRKYFFMFNALINSYVQQNKALIRDAVTQNKFAKSLIALLVQYRYGLNILSIQQESTIVGIKTQAKKTALKVTNPAYKCYRSILDTYTYNDVLDTTHNIIRYILDIMTDMRLKNIDIHEFLFTENVHVASGEQITDDRVSSLLISDSSRTQQTAAVTAATAARALASAKTEADAAAAVGEVGAAEAIAEAADAIEKAEAIKISASPVLYRKHIARELTQQAVARETAKNAEIAIPPPPSPQVQWPSPEQLSAFNKKLEIEKALKAFGSKDKTGTNVTSILNAIEHDIDVEPPNPIEYIKQYNEELINETKEIEKMLRSVVGVEDEEELKILTQFIKNITNHKTMRRRTENIVAPHLEPPSNNNNSASGSASSSSSRFYPASGSASGSSSRFYPASGSASSSSSRFYPASGSASSSSSRFYPASGSASGSASGAASGSSSRFYPASGSASGSSSRFYPASGSASGSASGAASGSSSRFYPASGSVAADSLSASALATKIYQKLNPDSGAAIGDENASITYLKQLNQDTISTLGLTLDELKALRAHRNRRILMTNEGGNRSPTKRTVKRRPKRHIKTRKHRKIRK